MLISREIRKLRPVTWGGDHEGHAYGIHAYIGYAYNGSCQYLEKQLVSALAAAKEGPTVIATLSSNMEIFEEN